MMGVVLVEKVEGQCIIQIVRRSFDGGPHVNLRVKEWRRVVSALCA